MKFSEKLGIVLLFLCIVSMIANVFPVSYVFGIVGVFVLLADWSK